jgi:hypothetical protein
LLLPLSCCPLLAQVRLIANSEGQEVLKPLAVRGITLRTVSACNDGPVLVTLQRERIQLALPTIRIINNERAIAVLTAYQGRNKKAVAAQIIQYATLVAAAMGGMNEVPAQVVGWLASASLGADQVGRKLAGEVPALGPLLAGVSSEPLVLGPGQCGTRTYYAAISSAKPVEAVIR